MRKENRMIAQIHDLQTAKELVPYVINDKKSVPYLYANLKTFDPANESVKLFTDQEDGALKGIYILYYDCLHFYTQEEDTYPRDRVLEMIETLSPRVTMLQDVIGQDIKDVLLKDFILERNYIIDMDNINVGPEVTFRSTIAGREDIVAIADLLLSEEEYSIVYDRDTLIKQMLERYDLGISRYYAAKEDGIVTASCSTYGETDDLALIGGVIVHKDFRRRGLAADVENHACADLEAEGLSRVGFVNYENGPSLALHKKLGAVVHATYSKFIRK